MLLSASTSWALQPVLDGPGLPGLAEAPGLLDWPLALAALAQLFRHVLLWVASLLPPILYMHCP